ncbi:unnamed protein product [Hermetia illucens]|uniref:Uncharacterized protein n=1 Tax=Hermetia illucens TaxID=343691 RepID=A0A7R8YUT5_HERIL|nr:unnamed protein product [Hermetia illucens]
MKFLFVRLCERANRGFRVFLRMGNGKVMSREVFGGVVRKLVCVWSEKMIVVKGARMEMIMPETVMGGGCGNGCLIGLRKMLR